MLRSSRTSVELKSTDWTLPAGHRLAVEIGTIVPGPHSDWLDTPSRETITVQNARLDLALDNPADDTTTDGARTPYLDTYLGYYTKNLPIGRPTFTLPSP